jgi:hypothetical protein
MAYELCLATASKQVPSGSDWNFFLDGKMRELPPDESEKADTFVSRFIRLIEIGEKFKWRGRLSWWPVSLPATTKNSAPQSLV